MSMKQLKEKSFLLKIMMILSRSCIWFVFLLHYFCLADFLCFCYCCPVSIYICTCVNTYLLHMYECMYGRPRRDARIFKWLQKVGRLVGRMCICVPSSQIWQTVAIVSCCYDCCIYRTRYSWFIMLNRLNMQVSWKVCPHIYKKYRCCSKYCGRHLHLLLQCVIGKAKYMQYDYVCCSLAAQRGLHKKMF